MIYCNNKELLRLLKGYKKTKDKKVANQIGAMFILISERLLRKANFCDYTEDRKSEMISDSTYFMWRFLDRFDVTKDNPFSYFTTVAFRAFLQYLNEQKKRGLVFTSIDYIDFFKNNDISCLEDHE